MTHKNKNDSHTTELKDNWWWEYELSLQDQQQHLNINLVGTQSRFCTMSPYNVLQVVIKASESNFIFSWLSFIPVNFLLPVFWEQKYDIDSSSNSIHHLPSSCYVFPIMSVCHSIYPSVCQYHFIYISVSLYNSNNSIYRNNWYLEC